MTDKNITEQRAAANARSQQESRAAQGLAPPRAKIWSIHFPQKIHVGQNSPQSTIIPGDAEWKGYDVEIDWARRVVVLTRAVEDSSGRMLHVTEQPFESGVYWRLKPELLPKEEGK